MTTTFGATAQRNAYGREAVLSATPARLLTMLYDRLLLDLNRAESAQVSADWATASQNLIHAQAIVAELTSSLRVDVWDGGKDLQALYTYVTVAMVNANVHRDVKLTEECITLLEPLRQAWHEAADLAPGASAGVATGATAPSLGGSLGIG